MNRFKHIFSRKHMLISLLSLFALMSIFMFFLNVVFYWQQAVKTEEEQRLFLLDCMETRVQELSNLLTHMKEDTDILFTMPSLETFCDTAVYSADAQFHLQTYAQSRYAFDAIAYYHESRQILFGFYHTPIAATDRESAMSQLQLTPDAFDQLLKGDCFAFTQGDQEKQLALSNRISDEVVCFRIIPSQTIENHLHFSSENNNFPIFSEYGVQITDRLGQTSIMESGNMNDEWLSSEFEVDNTGLHVTLFTPDRTASIVWSYLREMLLYYGSALFIISIMLISIFTEKLYKPIESTLEILPESLPSVSGEESEHGRIQAAIRMLSETNSAQQDLLSAQDELLRRSFLQRLFNGDLKSYSNIELLLEHYNLESHFDQYAVLILTTSDNHEMSDTETEFDAWLRTIQIPGFDLDFVTSKRDSLLVMISSNDDQADFNAASALLCSTFESHYTVRPSIFRSAVHNDAAEADVACLEASLAEERSMFLGMQQILLSYEDLKNLETPEHQLSDLIALEQQLLQAVLAKQVEKAQNSFAQCCSCIAKSSVSLRVQQSLMISLLVRLLSLNSTPNNPPINETDLAALLSSQLSSDQFWSQIKLLSAQVLPHASQEDDGGYSPRFKRILDYIHQHLREETLCSAEVADYFGMSQSSLTREFQKNTHTGFSSFVHMQRIDMAKVLLKQSNKSIKEIAAEVGYSNSLALTRAFHKYEGNTPGSYRNEREPE